jgi:hypothetical protein
MTNFKGIGEAKAVTICAAMELGRRRNDLDRQSEPASIVAGMHTSYFIPFFATSLTKSYGWLYSIEAGK